MNTPLVRHASQVLAGVPEVRCRYHLSEACHGFGMGLSLPDHPGKDRFQWLFLVPLKGGIGSTYITPQKAIYKWYILPIGGLYATYHLLRGLFLVPLKGGIGSIYITPQKAIYKWYILPIRGLYATYHLLREPETTIE